MKGHGIKMKREHFSAFRFACKRNPKLLKFTALCPMILAFLLVLLVSTVQKNFSSEYMNSIRNRYPLDLLVLHISELERFSGRDQVTVYDYYAAMDDNINACYLLDEKNSVLAIKGMIEEGRFPQSDTEILVSQEFVGNFYGSDVKYEECIGKQISFKGMTLEISGVLTDLSESRAEENLFADAYYQRKVRENAIFIPYNTIRLIGEKQDSEDIIVGVCEGISENAQLLEELKNACYNQTPSPFYAKIRDAQNMVNNMTRIFVIVLLVIYIIACVFMVSIVMTELFYRRKELGYLQIFGLKKKRACSLLMAEYVLKGMASLGAAVVLYICSIGVYGVWSKVLLSFEPVFTFGLLALLSGIYLLTARMAIGRFLKKNVMELIR